MGKTVVAPSLNETGQRLVKEEIEEYLQSLISAGYGEETVKTYRRALMRFFQWLGEDKVLFEGVVDQFSSDLVQAGYMPRTVSLFRNVINRFLASLNLWRYQSVSDKYADREIVQPELTREEYLRLLSSARNSNKEKAYLLVKVFGTLGLTVQELPELTVETVRQGAMELAARKLESTVRIPHYVQRELLDYIKRNGVADGSVFRGRNGQPLGRSVVTHTIQCLSKEAGVSPEKCNPRCLRKMYLATQENIRSNLSLLLNQTYDNLLKMEQEFTGWNEVTLD